MQLLLGPGGSVYSFLVNGVDVASRTRVVTAPGTGRPIRYVTDLSVSGWLEGDTQAALATAANNLRTAVQKGSYVDIVLKTDAGGQSAHKLINSQSISGVRIIDGPHLPNEPGAYATLLPFSFAASAEFVIRGAENVVLSLTETVSIVGTGGPVTKHRMILDGKPVKQLVYPNSIVRAQQHGQIVGHTKYPAAPAPLWPQDEQQDQRQIHRVSPRQLGRGHVEFPLDYSYVFEANRPLVGLPKLPPF